jgi:hypothetical protein
MDHRAGLQSRSFVTISANFVGRDTAVIDWHSAPCKREAGVTLAIEVVAVCALAPGPPRHTDCDISRPRALHQGGVRVEAMAAVTAARWPDVREPIMARDFFMKLGYRESVISFAVFCGLVFALTSIDPRVRERLTDLFGSGGGISPFGDRLSDLGSALWIALRHQSIENAPMLVFATVGVVLTLFMLKS